MNVPSLKSARARSVVVASVGNRCSSAGNAVAPVVEIPDIDPDEIDEVEPGEEGDLAILADLGLPDSVMSIIVGDTDLYADEQIGMIAARLGFADELSKTLEKLGH